MKIVLQRVSRASVTVDGKTVGEIGKGYLLLFGVKTGDTIDKAEKLADKIAKLRLFEDENDKINLSLKDVSGEVLVISQFTLYADCKKGTRPSFTDAEKPDIANEIYQKFVSMLKERIPKVECGIFGADMKVSLINDGPVTVILEE